jgi:hypothetical protein
MQKDLTASLEVLNVEFKLSQAKSVPESTRGVIEDQLKDIKGRTFYL